MLSIIVTFFKGSMGKVVIWLLVIAGVIAAVWGFYTYAASRGYTKGYQVAWAAQQKTIQAMVDAENAQRTATNNRITSLEQQSQRDAQMVRDLQTSLAKKQETVVTKYVHDNPKVAASCGVAPATIKALNALIGD